MIETPTKQCGACHSTCATCSGSLISNCLTCTNSLHYLYNGTCVASCPTGVAVYTQTTPTRSCPPCDSSCSLCSGGLATNCTSCLTNTYLTATNTCVATCPGSFYPTTNPNVCSPCHSYCSLCTGGTNSNCSACSGNNFYIPDLTKCDLLCPSPGYHTDSVSKTCIKCNSSCYNCNGGLATNCTECAGSTYLTTTNTCVSTCPASFFPSVNPNVCSSCHPFCSACTGALNT